MILLFDPFFGWEVGLCILFANKQDNKDTRLPHQFLTKTIHRAPNSDYLCGSERGNITKGNRIHVP